MLQSFFKQRPRRQVKRQVFGTFNGYTFADWQQSDDHIKWIREQMKEPKFRDMLAVLSNARPYTNLAAATEVDAMIGFGRRIGFDEMLGLIMSLAKFPEKPAPDVEADYGANEFDLKNVT